MSAMKKSRQRGISIIETTGALAIGTLMMIGLTQMIDNSLEDSKGQQAANYHSQVVAAARRYIPAHYTGLVADSASGKPATISLGQLSSDKLLPAGFGPTNAYQQRTCVLVRQRPVTVVGAPVQLDALVVTYGGDKIKGIGAVAANAGAGSGYIRSDSTATARGASWQLTGADLAAYQGQPCNDDGTVNVLTGGAGDADHLVSQIFFDGQPTADFLYRGKTGDPTANQMNVPIGMGGDAANVVSDTPCSTNAVAVTPAGKLASCVLQPSGTRQWKLVESESSWKPPVDNYAALPPTDKRGDVRMTLDSGRGFMYDGVSWIALAVDQNDNFRVPNDIIVGNDLTVERGNVRTIVGDISAAKNVHADGNVDAKGDVSAGWKVAGKHVIASQYLESETISLANREKFKVGGSCNIPVVNDQGQTVFAIPYGGYVEDVGFNLLYCDYDSTLKYAATKAP
jgi:hypothetical protein